MTPPKKRDGLPVLYFVGFLVLAFAVYFLWQNPPEAHLAPRDAGKVDTLQAQMGSLRDAMARLEQQKPPAPGASTADLQQLQAQVTALASKPTVAAAEFQQLASQVGALASKPAANDGQVQQLQAEVVALAAKPTVTPDQVSQLAQQVQSLGALPARIDALEQRPTFDPASVAAKFSASNDTLQQLAAKNDAADAKLSQTVTELQARVDSLGKQQEATAQKLQLSAKLQGVAAALVAGQKLGAIPGAPPALARFATEAPPTEASLRESFDKYAADAQAVNQPTAADNQDFASRLWARAQQSVTVRQGDHVLVGDPIAGVLAHAKEQLDAGNLAGSVETLKGLSGPAAKAMQPWTDKANALLDARAAITSMVAG